MKKNISIATLVFVMNQAICLNNTEYFSARSELFEFKYFPKLFYRKREESLAFDHTSSSL